MQIEQGAAGAWMLWAMLAVGAGLVLASLWQTSERFWHWKRARQMDAGEVMPAETVLRIGQSLAFAAPGVGGKNDALGEQADCQEADAQGASTCVAHISAVSRGLLWFALEMPPTRLRDMRASRAKDAHSLPQTGEALTFTVTGEDALYRFEARIRDSQPDPAQPSVTLFSVKMPMWLARIQRRQHVRVPLALRAAFEPAEVFGLALPANTGAIRGTLLDLSGGGLRMELEGAQSPHSAARLCEQLQAGALLEIKLDTPLLREETLRLAVRDCRRVARPGGLGVRLRGEFVNLPVCQRETLISMVFHASRTRRPQPSPRLQTAQ